MSDLQFHKLTDKISILSGFPFPSDNFSDQGIIPLIRIRDLLSNRLETFYTAAYPDQYVIRNGDILVGMDGDFNVVRWCKGNALLNQRVCKISSSTSELDDGYLFWLLEPKLIEIHRKTPQTTVRHLSTKDLKSIEAFFPSYDEQKIIAQILDTLDTQIQQTEVLIAKLEQVKEGMLNDLLTRGIDESGQLRPSPEQAPELYKESPLGLIPLEWQVTSISDITEKMVSGAAIKIHEFSDSGVGVIAKSDVTSNKYIDIKERDQFVPVKVADSYRQSIVSSKAAIVSLRDLVPSGPTVGMASKFEGDRQYILAQGTYGLYLKESEFVKDLFAEITRQSFFRNAVKTLTVGSTQVHVRSSEYINIVIPKPNLNEQLRIVSLINSIDRQTHLELDKLKKLKKTKCGLVADLLSGRVRVTPLLEQQAEAS